MITQTGTTFGVSLDSGRMETGLRELNPDISFDLAVRKPDEFVNTLETDPGRRRAIEAGRLPVCYRDTYICAMDRGIVPEFKLWSVKEAPVEVEWSDADQDGASLQYVTIPPSSEGYEDMKSMAQRGQHNGLIHLEDGRLAQLKPMGVRKVRSHIIRMGWRHTFSRLIAAGIPGINAATVSAKFGVDMTAFPVGPPEELYAALVEE